MGMEQRAKRNPSKDQIEVEKKGNRITYTNEGAVAEVSAYPNEWYLSNIEAWIEEEGYAGALMRRIVADAKGVGVEKITLITTPDVRGFFEHYGFRVVGYADSSGNNLGFSQEVYDRLETVLYAMELRLKASDIRHNPARVRRNPLAQPSPTMAFSFRKGVVPGVVEVYLYEPDDIDDTERSMVAGMMASFTGKRPRWEASGVAACPGYGPLIYDLTATLLKQKLHATRDRSEAAKRFWKRQGKNYIEPLSPEDFRAKYGVSVDDLYDRGLELTPEDLRRMSDHLVSVFFGAKEAEKKGKPLALLRCAVPNGRRRR